MCPPKCIIIIINLKYAGVHIYMLLYGKNINDNVYNLS